MKIGFFGTPEIAARCLESLAQHHQILFAVSCEDKPKGRCLHVCETPVKEAAQSLGIPLLQPPSIKDPAFPAELASYGADIFVVVAYGRIIPRAVFSLPPLGTINLHPSLLPKYRGAAPVESAILSGETVSGVTVQYINERLDAGDIVLQKEIPVGPDMTAGEFFSIATEEGAAMLDRAVKGLSDGSLKPFVQDESRSTVCGKITRESARIIWDDGAASIHNLVRAYNPKPFAWTQLRGKSVRIMKTALASDPELPACAPGEIAVFRKKRLITGTGSGGIEILSLQPETKKVMDALSFINGMRLQPGERWDRGE